MREARRYLRPRYQHVDIVTTQVLRFLYDSQARIDMHLIDCGGIKYDMLVPKNWVIVREDPRVCPEKVRNRTNDLAIGFQHRRPFLQDRRWIFKMLEKPG